MSTRLAGAAILLFAWTSTPATGQMAPIADDNGPRHVRSHAQTLSASDLSLFERSFDYADRKQWTEALQLASQLSNAAARDVILWRAYSTKDNGIAFSELDRFLAGHREWPNQKSLQARAEEAMPADSMQPDQVISWFQGREPVSGEGMVKLGDANIRNKAPFVGNLTWKALQRTGTYLDDQERELIMSIVGTVIFYPEDAARDPEPVAPTITSISQLLYGQAAGTGTNVTQHLLRCNNYTDCDVVTLNTSYTHTPFTARVETMMRSIADKIATRTAIPNNSAEVGFVNQTTEPVYKMLSIGATIPGSGLSDSLIAQYRDVIAADYAYVFLERNLRVGMAALDKDYTLQQTQRDRANLVRQRAQAMLLQLSQEKNLLYQKVGSFRAVSSHLEQLERQLRSSMPQHVMDMLGQQAAFQAR